MAEIKIAPKVGERNRLPHEHNRMPTGKEDYKQTYTGKPTTELMKVNKTAKAEQIDAYGTARIQNDNKDYAITIKGYEIIDPASNIKSQYPVKDIDLMLLRCLLTKLVETKDPLIKMPLSEYMEARGIPQGKENRKDAAAQVRKSMEALKRIERMEYIEKGSGWIDISLYGGTNKMEGGIAYWRFNPDAIEKAFLTRNKGKAIMPYHRALTSLHIKNNPHAWYLGEKLSVQKNMNYHLPTADIIKVKHLLKACPNMPRYEDVKGKKAGGHVSQRIIAPFVRDMDALIEIGMLTSWEYCGIKGAPLKDPDPEKDYHVWIETNVRVFWKDYPHRDKKPRKKKKPVKSKNSKNPTK